MSAVLDPTRPPVVPAIRRRRRRRTRAVVVILVAVIVILSAVALAVGDYALSVTESWQAARGLSPDPLANYFVQHQRLPRIAAALVVGAALGTSGGIFQTLTRNPLGSPDVIGFTTGAATGALLQIIVFGAAPAHVGIGAVVGGLGAAAVVYGLSYRGGSSSHRLVLVATATAIAGPIAFVAPAAPQLSVRLLGRGRLSLPVAALMGAAVVLASDLVAQRLFAPMQLPVGVVTGTIGGGYLIWLLHRQWRRTTG